MDIYGLLKNDSTLPPAAHKAMKLAYEGALIDLKITDCGDPRIPEISHCVVEFAHGGEGIARLCDNAWLKPDEYERQTMACFKVWEHSEPDEQKLWRALAIELLRLAASLRNQQVP